MPPNLGNVSTNSAICALPGSKEEQEQSLQAEAAVIKRKYADARAIINKEAVDKIQALQGESNAFLTPKDELLLNQSAQIDQNKAEEHDALSKITRKLAALKWS